MIAETLRESLRKLVFAARTTGGVAGRDEALCAACDEAEAILMMTECAKCKRTKNDWDCAEDNCPMSSLTTRNQGVSEK